LKSIYVCGVGILCDKSKNRLVEKMKLLQLIIGFTSVAIASAAANCKGIITVRKEMNGMHLIKINSRSY
jgi:hypothetical protein